MQLYFVRHGESVANRSGIFSNRGWMHPLTPDGRGQAHRLAEQMREKSIVAVYASPLMRAVETAEIVGGFLDLPVTRDERLREYDCGIHEGRSYANGAADYERVAAAWLAGDLEARIEGGESATEIVARMGELLGSLRATYRDGDAVLLVSHGGTLRTALPRLLDGLTPQHTAVHGLANCDGVDVEWHGDRFIARRWGKTML